MNIERPKCKRIVPLNAREVFRGLRFSVLQWEQELFDGTTATFENLKRISDSVIVLAQTNEGYVLTKESQPGRDPFIGVPAGVINPGEDPLTAAKRELLEETGFASNHWQLWYADQAHASIDWAEYYFVAKNCQKISEQKLDPGEQIELELLPFEEFTLRLVHRDNRIKTLRLRFLEALLFPEKMSEIKRFL